MEDGRERDAYLDARDRALRAVVSAEDFIEAQAAWRLAKAHNRVAKERQDFADTGLESQRETLPQLRAPGIEGGSRARGKGE